MFNPFKEYMNYYSVQFIVQIQALSTSECWWRHPEIILSRQSSINHETKLAHGLDQFCN